MDLLKQMGDLKHCNSKLLYFKHLFKVKKDTVMMKFMR